MRLLNVKIIAVCGFHITTETVIDVIFPFPSGSKSTAPGDRLRLAPERLYAVSRAPYTSFFIIQLSFIIITLYKRVVFTRTRTYNMLSRRAHVQTSGANVRRLCPLLSW